MRNNSGFTLIEVLVALAILSIAMTAIILSTSQNIKDTLYLQNKTVATWVGTQVVNETRAGLLKPPLAPDSLKDETEMLNKRWSWEASLKDTPNPHIKEINVMVFDKANKQLLSQLRSYFYIQP